MKLTILTATSTMMMTMTILTNGGNDCDNNDDDENGEIVDGKVMLSLLHFCITADGPLVLLRGGV